MYNIHEPSTAWRLSGACKGDAVESPTASATANTGREYILVVAKVVVKDIGELEEICNSECQYARKPEFYSAKSQPSLDRQPKSRPRSPPLVLTSS